MKQRFMKRGLSMLLALAMMFGLMQTPYMTQEVKAAAENVLSGKQPSDVAWVDGRNMTHVGGGGAVGHTDDSSAVYATDGYYEVASQYRYGEVTNSTTDDARCYVEYDLGALCDITDVNLWRYWSDNRNYDPTVIVTSKTGTWTPGADGVSVIYSSDDGNVFGFGTDTAIVYDADGYNESSAGLLLDIESQGISARYIRIYAAGSNSNKANHIVEFEVYANETETSVALKNAETYLDFPTHYQNRTSTHVAGQVTHPDVVYMADGWNNYKYWAVYTPNTSVTSQYENPYIVASDDGLTWVEPTINGETVSNPIEPEPVSTRYHNCDADMIYNEEMDAMMAYWNWADDQQGGVGAEVRVRISYDGIHWGVPSTYDETTGIWTAPANDSERTLKAATTDSNGRDNSFITAIASADRYDMLSPTFTYDSYRDIYVMWSNDTGDVGYNNGQNNKVQTRWSKDGLNWSEPKDVNNFLSTTSSGASLAPWHQDVNYVPELKEYWALSQCFTGNNPDGSMLYLTTSKDGINWNQVGTEAILNPGDAGEWDSFQIYRSCFVYDNDVLKVWYSALQDGTANTYVADSSGNKTILALSEDTRIWRIGYTDNSYENIMTALTGDGTKPTLVTGTALNLTVGQTTLDAGDETTATAVFTPTNTSDQIVKYTSSDESVVTITPFGEVVAVADGTATITAETQDGISDTVTITVGDGTTTDPDDDTWTKINDSQMSYTGTWNSEGGNYYQSDAHNSNSPDAYAQFTFTGTAFRWYGQNDTNFKYGKIYVDGKYVGIANAYGSAATQQLIAEVTGLENGNHTVRIYPYGPQNEYWNTIDIDYAEYNGSSSNANAAAAVIQMIKEETEEYSSISAVTLDAGNTETFALFATNGNKIVAEEYTYAVANSTIASVTENADGTITINGHYGGTTTLTITAATGATATVQITVEGDAAPDPDPNPSETVNPDDVNGTWNNIINSHDSKMSYAGTWTSDSSGSFYNGDAYYSNDPSASVTFSFTGTAFRWYGQTEANFKYGKIYVDGVYVGIANAYGTAEVQQLIAEVTGLSEGEHTVKIVPYGPADAHWNTIDMDYVDYSTTAGYADVTAASIVATKEYDDLSSVTVLVDNTADINAFAKNGDVYVAENIAYTVADPSIATVTKAADGTFTITGVAAGTTTLTLTADGATKVVRINVTEPGAKRLTISNENPLLIVPVYGQSYSANGSAMQWNDTVAGRWSSLPADIKDNAVILIHAGMIPSGSLQAFYEQQLDIAEANGIPVMIVTATAGLHDEWGWTSTPDVAYDEEWLRNALNNYNSLKGFVITENYWTSYDTVATAAATHLEIASEYGGYVIWFEHDEPVIENILTNSAFSNALAQYGDNFAFTWKNTPAGRSANAGTSSYMQGLWLAGVIDQWGGLMDTWKWYEKSYGKLFQGTISYNGYAPNGEDEECRAVVMEPEALLGIEMLSIYANGGTIYSFEHPAYTQGINDANTPAFTNVIYETFKYIIENPAPAKAEVLEDTKVVLHGNLSSADEFHTGVTSDDQTLPTHSTGRYGLLPAVPSSVSVDEIPSDKVAALSTLSSMSTANKISYLNALYTEGAYTGDAFAQNLDGKWILYNSNVNTDTDQSATVAIDGQSVKVDMTPHTFTIMERTDNVISVHLNNYRVNKDSIWNGYGSSTQKWDPDVNNLLETWLEYNYMTNTADDASTYRETVYTLTGLSAAPTVTVNREKETDFTKDVEFNSSTGTATITVTANGYIDFDILLNEPAAFAPDDIVIDFGLPVTMNYGVLAETITGGTSASGNPVTVTGDSADGAWSVTYTPYMVLQVKDTVTLTTESNAEYTFDVYPANNVYYEARYANYQSKNTSNLWNIGYTDLKQTASAAGSEANYGYDDAYKMIASATAISKEIGDSATFTYTGKGIDIYMDCTANTGKALVQIKVTDASGTLEKMVITDTQLAVEEESVGDTMGLGNVTTANGVPVISLELEHGVHCVTINHIKYTGETDSELIISGFRVYDTLDTDNDTEAAAVYAADNELEPVYIKMRDQLIDSLKADDFVYNEDSEYAEQIAAGLAENIMGTAGKSNGVVIVSGSAAGYTADDLQDFIDNSSKNELFLYPGQSLVFSVADPTNLQLGLRALESNVDYSVNGGAAQTMASKVDMFYPIPAVDDDNNGTYTVTITNESTWDDTTKAPAVLAITKLKAFSSTGTYELQTLSSEDYMTALLSLGYKSAEDGEGTGGSETETPETQGVLRISGADRYATSFAVADALKKQLDVEKFDAVIVATGKKFADALSGSYLATVKNAPILLTNEKRVDELVSYVKENLKTDGMVYILGGTAVVPEDVETELADYDVKRLSGADRYETNIAILNEAGVNGREILIATGTGFADSLSASATGRPILLVKDEITDAHRAVLRQYDGSKIYIIGGTGVVSEEIQTALIGHGRIFRISGGTRYETSVEVAREFFENADAAVVASAKEFPDGLCGGSLAAAMNAPLILTADGKTSAAAEYMQSEGIRSGYVLGGATRISEESVEEIF